MFRAFRREERLGVRGRVLHASTCSRHVVARPDRRPRPADLHRRRCRSVDAAPCAARSRTACTSTRCDTPRYVKEVILADVADRRRSGPAATRRAPARLPGVHDRRRSPTRSQEPVGARGALHRPRSTADRDRRVASSSSTVGTPTTPDAPRAARRGATSPGWRPDPGRRDARRVRDHRRRWDGLADRAHPACPLGTTASTDAGLERGRRAARAAAGTPSGANAVRRSRALDRR